MATMAASAATSRTCRRGVTRPASASRGRRPARRRRAAAASAAVSIPSTNTLTRCLVELGARRILEPRERLAEVERLAVRAGRRHRRERVADGEDPGDERDFLALEPVEVAVAVPALVVVADPGPDDLDVREVADDHVAEGDVLLDDVVLGRGQLAGLAQDRVRDADLADVVEQARDMDRAR